MAKRFSGESKKNKHRKTSIVFLFSLYWSIIYCSLSHAESTSKQLEYTDKYNTIQKQEKQCHTAKRQNMDNNQKFLIDEKGHACYLQDINALIYLLQHPEQGTPDQHPLFGKIEYFFPKNPGKPVVKALYLDIPINEGLFNIQLQRNGEHEPWIRSNIFGSEIKSGTNFLPNFLKSDFEKLNLEFSRIEKDENFPEDKHYIYTTRTLPKFSVNFYVEAAYLEKDIDYPKNFTSLKIRIIN